MTKWIKRSFNEITLTSMVAEWLKKYNASKKPILENQPPKTTQGTRPKYREYTKPINLSNERPQYVVWKNVIFQVG